MEWLPSGLSLRRFRSGILSRPFHRTSVLLLIVLAFQAGNSGNIWVGKAFAVYESQGNEVSFPADISFRHPTSESSQFKLYRLVFMCRGSSLPGVGGLGIHAGLDLELKLPSAVFLLDHPLVV